MHDQLVLAVIGGMLVVSEGVEQQGSLLVEALRLLVITVSALLVEGVTARDVVW